MTYEFIMEQGNKIVITLDDKKGKAAVCDYSRGINCKEFETPSNLQQVPLLFPKETTSC